MNEREWMKEVRRKLENEQKLKNKKLSFFNSKRMPYSSEIISYKGDEPEKTNLIKYETDLIVCQNFLENEWKPRIIIEG